MKKPEETVWIDRGWQCAFIGFCPSGVAWKDSMERMGIEGECPYPSTAGCMTEFINADGHTCLIVTISDEADTREQVEAIGLVVHECVHVWQKVLELMREDNPGDEVEAYAVQSIFQSIWQAYLRLRKPTFKPKPKKSQKRTPK